MMAWLLHGDPTCFGCLPTFSTTFAGRKMFTATHSYTKVIVPLDGHVTARTVRQGNHVQPGQGLPAPVPRNAWV